MYSNENNCYTVRFDNENLNLAVDARGRIWSSIQFAVDWAESGVNFAKIRATLYKNDQPYKKFRYDYMARKVIMEDAE